jgi:hypothetical protein
MNKLCLLACLLIPAALNAQTAPKVVFTGDDFTFNWQQTPQFTANQNWVGAGLDVCCIGGVTGLVEADFQANVINQHPAFVHIMTGAGNISDQHPSTPLGLVWHQYEESLIEMVQMAQKAGIKVILGNLPADTGSPFEDPQATQFFNAWLANYGLVNNIPVVNYHDALCQCVGSTSPNDTFVASLAVPPTPTSDPSAVPNDAGYALVTQMAQIAIQTYGLTIKSGYLSNMVIRNTFGGSPPESQVNTVSEGEILTFVPQAKWSDGVVRPMLNQDFNGLQGTWTSSNPAVMYVNQQGQAFPYSVGKANISFKSASGVVFSPWTMTVGLVYPFE